MILPPDIRRALDFLPFGVSDGSGAFDALRSEAEYANALLHTGEGEGADFLGWVGLPSAVTPEVLDGIRAAADELRRRAEVVIVIGIGGSYLGAKAVMEALGDPFASLSRERREGGDHNSPTIVFAGHTLSEDYMASLMEAVEGREVAAIVISKSGTTTEPAIAFRIARQHIERRYGAVGAAERIVAVTDGACGALRTLADEAGYKTFAIPDDVGGRYSVLTPVGLLPLAVAGVDIEALMAGARRMEAATAPDVPFAENPAAMYAAARHALYGAGYKIEILAAYEPALQSFIEWWKQLFGESDGKRGRGIFPAGAIFTTDLHSMGQYIQQGERTIFETFLSVAESRRELRVERAENDGDGLDFLAGRRLGEVNRKAEQGTTLAHVDGGVPCIRVEIPRLDEGALGELIYFFEKACAIGGYMAGINPFDQPGVEAYKRNMFALLGKPGYEAEADEIRKRLG
ncbi:MAG: glucose-6-phosphate isomerase [Alistipes sp.]|jgi:glucose-6-phosphate isomerase|nr:glucose-6-phosphate isomerase [Alistipes sp.]